MRVAAIDEFDDPEVLRLHRLPVPAPAAGEVLIRIDMAVAEEPPLLIQFGRWCLGI